jgi:hypothetical protein
MLLNYVYDGRPSRLALLGISKRLHFHYSYMRNIPFRFTVQDPSTGVKLCY